MRHAIKRINDMTCRILWYSNHKKQWRKLRQKPWKMSLMLTCPPYYTGRFQNRYEEVYREGALWDYVKSLTAENCKWQFPYITCSKTSASHQ